MAYSARVLADSLSPAGHRLITMTAELPRFALAEFNTHRMFSRNSASSRAIPAFLRIINSVRDPFIPDVFPVNQPGMQSHIFLEGSEHETAVRAWLRGRDRAVLSVLELLVGEQVMAGYASLQVGSLADQVDLIEEILGAHQGSGPNVHKQISARPLEPYLWHTVLVSATEWGNFFGLRLAPDAQREIRLAAKKMDEAMRASTPTPLAEGQWHMPLLHPDELQMAAGNPEFWRMVSAGRCARVSYLTHDGRRDPSKDVELYDRLATSGHMSPLEHVARPMTAEELGDSEFQGNFRGWSQLRQTFLHQADRSQVTADSTGW
jgi:hypothetical protein